MVRFQTKSRNFLPWIRRHKFLSLLYAIVLLVIGVFVYEKVALELNKRAFAQARTAIDTIYADIVAKVGQPDDYKVSNNCSRLSREFEREPIVCNVNTSFIYGVSNEDEANSLFKKIQGFISDYKTTFKPIKPLSSSITSLLVVNTYYHDAQDYYKIGVLDCTAKYVYDTPEETYLQLKESRLKPFYIRIGCSDWARQEYYPLQ